MATFRLSVVAPDRSVVDEEVNSVIVPGAEGYFGVMSHHQGLVNVLKAGQLEYDSAETKQRHFVAIGGGFAEFSDNRLTILADSATLAHEVDVAREEEALARARAALRGESSPLTFEEAQQELERAMARIKAAQRASAKPD